MKSRLRPSTVKALTHPPFQRGKCTLLELRRNRKGDLQDTTESFVNTAQALKLERTISNLYYVPYKQNLKESARRLRNNSTLGEVLLWKELRAGQIEGHTFNRQKPIGRFIVDFYCKRLNLVIEVDGGYHYEKEQILIDKERQKLIEETGLNFLRFHDEEIRKDMPQVLQKLRKYIKEFER